MRRKAIGGDKAFIFTSCVFAGDWIVNAHHPISNEKWKKVHGTVGQL